MARGLGKGIDALFPNMKTGKKEEVVQEVAINQLRPNPYQPRKVFQKEAIDELKESILQHGILQPLIVRESIKGFEIVVGERRYRAAKKANLEKVPVVVRELSDQQMMEMAILENLQREDLTPIEEATAYQMLIERLDLTQEQLAKRLGKSRPHIANHIRLLSLPAEIQQHISDGIISMGHGRALLGLRKKEHLSSLVKKVVKEHINVRQLETLIQQLNENVPRETKVAKEEKNLFLEEQENVLRETLGTTVTIKQLKGKEKGKIEIEFFNQEDLQRILDLLDR
ncbi:ParB family chromosome partitioning protein [Oikeobacillus pervagus]|uniref:ParB family chromosome partitioning protein n=1 Tax=Oikeobacillus pervagus TaxID=1325931 RepID=A0AAJ1SZ03_9BACI|nr:ParB/RepB/Spo0J family partition protein [Oikeobacillus pervagus]MDQ0215410.1 ParB family chromosome partitioning protein [Oikeobacillus pervagus]